MLIRFCCNRNTKRHFHPSPSKMTLEVIFVNLGPYPWCKASPDPVSFKHHSFNNDNWCIMEIHFTDQPFQLKWKGSLMSVLSECVRRASSDQLTMFPLKSMLGNFLLMYLMAVSMPLSVSRGRRVFGSAQVCDKRRHNNVYWMMNDFGFLNTLISDLPGDLRSAIRAAPVWLSSSSH